MKTDKADSATKMVPRPIPLAAKTDSPIEKKQTAHVGSFEKSPKPISGESIEIYALLKLNLLEDIDVYV